MHKIMVAGIGTDVGKTIVSAILITLLNGDYWKPIQCGDEENSDSVKIKQWIDPSKHSIFPPAYSLKASVSPHHAARLENRLIMLETISLPQTNRPLIIEGVGGIFVPLTTSSLSFDRFTSWNCDWIIVSKHYLGSINHTLLTVEALKYLQVSILGIIFNGEPDPDSEEAILEISQISCLGRLFPERCLTQKTLQKYVKEWQPNFSRLLP